jgi:hypothetical protein
MNQDMAFHCHEVVTHNGNTLPTWRLSPVRLFNRQGDEKEDFEGRIDFAISDRDSFPLQRWRPARAASFERQ